jgi:uncharacterized SAM-dependent methyltransferase
MANDGSLAHVGEALGSGRDSRWALVLSGEKPTDLIKELIHDLAIPHSRKVATKFSYIGMTAAIAWANACSDWFYPVMRDSIDAFDRYWRPILPLVRDVGYHYVSLGVGTGQKDRVVLGLHSLHPTMLYIPVDISAEMIRLGIDETKKLTGLRMMPVHLDFSVTAHLEDLKQLVHRLVDDEPVIYSLLGNTVANIDEDSELLGSIGDMLRPQDRLLLEVSTTSEINDEALDEARAEYSISETYKIHATSALSQFTDLAIDNKMLIFRAEKEDESTIRIETQYENATGEPVVVTLPDHRTQIDFAPEETIRVTLSRKYLPSGVDKLIAEAGLTRLSEPPAPRPGRTRRPVFSRDLMLLAKTPPAPPKPSVADELLRTGKAARR